MLATMNSVDQCMKSNAGTILAHESIGDSIIPQEIGTINETVSASTEENGLGSSELSDGDYKTDFEMIMNSPYPEDPKFSQPGDINEPLYFESDHVALKGNEDYRQLLRTFVILQSQRKKALHDLDELHDLQRKALRDPANFVSELRSTKDRFPRRQTIAELPAIQWERYTNDVESVLRSVGGSHHMTRQKQRRDLLDGIRSPCREKKSAPSSSSSSSSVDTARTVVAVKSEVDRMDDQTDDEQSSTFNKPWTAEEQRKLEQLLEKYPTERFESRRFRKIAEELPGRTTQQACPVLLF